MRLAIFVIIFCSIFCCKKDIIQEEVKTENPVPHDSDSINTNTVAVFDLPQDSAPHFVNICYVDLNKIGMISRFRSGAGHDYSDDFEFCRSMKHYFSPLNNTADSIRIFSPVKGKVVRMFSEWAGNQIQIQSDDYPAFCFTLFHVNSFAGISEGVQLQEGELVGYHIGTMTSSDIAVKVNTSVNGPKSDTLGAASTRYFSIFNLMTDSIFNLFRQRGINTREETIITKDERDASPLDCNGEAFLNQGSIQNWINLQ